MLKRHFLIFFIGLAFVAIFFNSCQTSDSSIGIELLSTDELLQTGYVDTISIEGYTVYDDTLNTLGCTYALIGSLNDPVFGQTQANFYTQIRPSTSKVNFGTSPVADSAFLYLPYRKVSYGDSVSNLKFKVYMLSEGFNDSVSMYSHNTLEYSDDDFIGETVFKPNYSGSNPHLKIPLNQKFTEKLFTADTSLMNDVDKFLNFFKGIAIIAEPQIHQNSGSVVGFNIPSDLCKITIFYQAQGDTAQKKYDFLINSFCKRFQHYSHNYAEAVPQLKNQLDGDLSLGDEFVFLQAMSGVKTKISFPYIKNLKGDEIIAINDAQLIIKSASNSDVFPKPTKLSIRLAGANGTTCPMALPDETTGYFDGTYNEKTQTYRFRISRYVQQIINDEIDGRNGLFLSIPASNTGTRLVLHGFKSPEAQIKLYIKYSIIK